MQHFALIYIYILVAAWRSNGLALSLSRTANGIRDRHAADGFAQKQWQYVLKGRTNITSLGEWNSCNRMRGSDRTEPRPWWTEYAPAVRSAVKYEEEMKRDEWK